MINVLKQGKHHTQFRLQKHFKKKFETTTQGANHSKMVYEVLDFFLWGFLKIFVKVYVI